MEIFLLILVSFAASWLTFFSGFGLGTLLWPVFYLLFQDLMLAIAATAIVHFLNNVFKFMLMKKSVDWKVVTPFGLAAIPAAFVGAILLDQFEDFPLTAYQIGEKTFSVYLLNVIFGAILIVFALIELVPKWSLAFSKQSLWVGGAISGFFGGLSGHQGALRSAFLIKYQLQKEVFIATGIVIALIVDVVRTSVYFSTYNFQGLANRWELIVFSLLAAVVGAISGKLLLKKIKIKGLTLFVSVAMLVFGLALASGLLNK
jgi:uncharacterized membrane protein YfcA